MTVAERRHGEAGALDGAMSGPADSDGPTRRPHGLVARGLSRLIGWYQVGHQDRPSPCRFVPS
ncbi:MAG TPA: hypothetical protein VFQ15_07255, partial [Jiangellaceae bacterium]|nr:hypothetical protein [Jiangellaceae bacterium]